MSPIPNKPPKTCDLPTAWFAALEAARRRGDRGGERLAREQLARLGVHVRIARHAMRPTADAPTSREKGGGPHA